MDYAKTNIQLYNQLRSLNYTNENIILVRKAYQLAMKLFSGMYRPSGSTFISHSVGTASVLASFKLPLRMVIAGLLHATYEHGDFGTVTKKLSESRRSYIKLNTGAEVEEYIAMYTELKWNSQAITSILSGFDSLSPNARAVLLIRIANELEDNLDLAALYCPDAQKRKNYIQQHGVDITELANKLGLPELAVELKRVFSETLSGSIASELISKSKNNRAFRISPESYKKRFYVELNSQFIKGIGRIKKIKKQLLK